MLLRDKISYLNSSAREKFEVPQLSMVYLPYTAVQTVFTEVISLRHKTASETTHKAI